MNDKNQISVYKYMINQIKYNCEKQMVSITNNKFTYENCDIYEKNIDIYLTNNEINNMKNGIYNFKTKNLKKIEYMLSIKQQLYIPPFKSINEKEIYLDAINSMSERTNIKSIFIDLKNSYNIYKIIKDFDLMIIPQTLCIILSFFLFAISFHSVNIFTLIMEIICVNIFPTALFGTFTLIEKRIKNSIQNKEFKSSISTALVNVETLSENILKYDKQITKQGFNQTKMNNPILYEIYKLLELSSILPSSVSQKYVERIKVVLKEYTEVINLDKQNSYEDYESIENIIKKIGIIEYDLKNNIYKNQNNNIYDNELDAVTKKIKLLEKRNKKI